ncbi:MAG: hypothetical protein QM729_03260 [Solirubrobacterales bacterium]
MTSVDGTATAPSRRAPDREELLAQARALLPALRERAAAAEAAAMVPEQTVDDIVAGGLNRIGVPLRFGGLDVEYELMHEVTMELGRACGATAWIYVLCGVHAFWLGFFPPEGQEEVFAEGPDVIVSSASFSMDCRYERVEGGVRVSGHWKFVSGSDHAAWVILVTKGPEGILEVLVPRSQFEVLQGTWDVSGLRGTGSKDVLVEDVFVPTSRTQPGGSLDQVFEPGAWDTAYDFHRQRRYSVPKPSLLLWEFIAAANGIAQGALDLTLERVGSGAILESEIARSAAEIDTAKQLLRSDLEDAQRKGESGDQLTSADLTRYARDRAYAGRLVVGATDRLFALARGDALDSSDPLQRLQRDVQAAVKRDLLVFDFVGQPYGRVLLGLDAGPPP